MVGLYSYLDVITLTLQLLLQLSEPLISAPQFPAVTACPGSQQVGLISAD